MSYASFLAAKTRAAGAVGHDVAPGDVHPLLFDWQAKVTRWAVRRGRCAVWLDCGMGKSPIQLQWARLSGDTSLIIAPLSVARQTADIEAPKVDMDVRYIRSQAEVTGPGVYATNYEMAHAFDPAAFDAVVFDESSIVKHHTSETRRRLCTDWAVVPRRLACTATPAPNDIQELTNHAELLGVMPRAEMLAAYFVHDDEGWRLKGHAVEPMWRWISTWAITARRPSDLGYSDEGYLLPPLRVHEERVDHEIESPDQLFATDIGGVGGRAAVRRQTMEARILRTMEVVNARRPGEEAGIHAAVGEGQPGARSGVSKSNSRQAQRPTPTEVRRGPGATGGTEGQGSGVSDTDSDAAVSGCAEVQDRSVRAGTNDERGMRGVPRSSGLRPSGEDACRPRSLNGSSSGGAVPAVQSGARTSSRRPDKDHGPVRLRDGGSEPWIIWCGLNDEQDELARLLGDRAISIYGSLTAEEKERRLLSWLAGDAPILLTKPAVCGVGLNLQRAHRMAFVGIGDSYEAYYQAIRRCYRFGQTEPVDAHIVVSAIESQIVANVRRKEQQDRDRITHLVRYSREELAHVE